MGWLENVDFLDTKGEILSRGMILKRGTFPPKHKGFISDQKYNAAKESIPAQYIVTIFSVNYVSPHEGICID